MLKPVDPALFLSVTAIDPFGPVSSLHVPRAHPWDFCPLGFKDHAFNAPTQQLGPLPAPHFPDPFRARFASRNPPKTGQTSPCPASRVRPAEWLVQKPFWERPAGPKHTR